MVDEGRASTRGVEVLVQKKLTRSLYGMAGGSWFRSAYRGLDGEWRSRAWDNRWVATLRRRRGSLHSLLCGPVDGAEQWSHR